jgi:NADPH2:quinone reductase
MAQAQAVRFHRTGGPEVLQLESIDPGLPGNGEVLLRQTAVGVNFIDTYHRSGLYPLPLPSGLGSEAAGVVELVGAGVTFVQVGDRVAYAGGPVGAYADRRVMRAERLVVLPDGIDEATAAAMMLKGMTAECLIRRAFRVEPGMTVLFHAAAGGVGLIACAWLAHLGATVIGTVGDDGKVELARQHGCHHVINYSREDFVARVKELTSGRGVPVVYDGVGKTTLVRSLDCLAPRGMLVTYGNASGRPDAIDPLVLSQKGSLYLTRPTMVDYTRTRPELEQSAAQLFAVVKSGAVKVEVKQRFPLSEAAAAHRALEGRQTTGSTVLVTWQ